MFSYLGGSKCVVGIKLGPQVLSFVERFIILCPYLGESTMEGLEESTMGSLGESTMGGLGESTMGGLRESTMGGLGKVWESP